MKKLTSSVENITPSMSVNYLKTMPVNRKVRMAQVIFLRDEILANRFLTTHQGIAFNDRGELIDGQHRLLAIQAAGKVVPLMVTRNVPHHRNGDVNLFAMDVIDNGVKRSAADQIGLMHGVKNTNLTAAAARIIAGICLGDSSHRFKSSVSNILPVLSVYGGEIEEIIEQALVYRIIRNSSFVGVMAMALKVAPSTAIEFSKQVGSGEQIKHGDPAYAIREYIIKRGVAKSAGLRRSFTECLGNVFVHAIRGTSIRLVKSGSGGIDYLTSKQRGDVEKVRQAFSKGR